MHDNILKNNEKVKKDKCAIINFFLSSRWDEHNEYINICIFIESIFNTVSYLKEMCVFAYLFLHENYFLL